MKGQQDLDPAILGAENYYEGPRTGYRLHL